MWLVRRLYSITFWRLGLLGLAATSLVGVACSHNKVAAVKKIEPVLLAELALAPVDFDNTYVIDQDGYLDEDGNPVQQVTREFRRQMRSRAATPQAGTTAVASTILVTVGEPGVDQAMEFFDTANDDAVGPPNLVDFIQQRIPGSRDVHAELLPDFPTYDDDTVANRITWQQTINGQDQMVKAYGVYIRSGGLIAFVALRAAAEAGGGDPEGLYQQTEAATKRQSEKLKVPVALIGPRK